MAHMVGGKGPYPDKAGEFCGNFYPDGLLPPDRGAASRQREYLVRMRFGRPRPCKATYVTADNGWVGLYLKTDRPLFDWEVPCETPPELWEPSGFFA